VAIARLPGPVTLAFMPYGAEVERLAARGRGEGHEILATGSDGASANNLPFAKAHIVLDVVPTPDEIDRARAQRRRRHASALPVFARAYRQMSQVG
jgi:polysaccharide deacetylase 2 family uncharacterized protein YibQ